MIETEVLNEVNLVDFWKNVENEQLRMSNKKGFSGLDIDLSKMYGDIVVRNPIQGEIVSAKYEGIFADQHSFSVVGYKDFIHVDNKPNENKYLKNLKIGDIVDVIISKVDNKSYWISGSIAEIYENQAHADLKSLDDDLVIMAFVKSINPAGYDVEIVHNGITFAGFMPNTLAGINKLYNPDSIVGTTIECMIESFSNDEGTYIISRRKYLKTLIPKAIDELRTNTVYTGNVTGTTPFGVFVEFNNCLTGMIHKANILEDWQDRITEIKPGMSIEFYVKEIVKEKIILTQIIRDTLWDTIKGGQIIEGKVKDSKQFGILVSLDEETVGLIHTSEVEKSGKSLSNGSKVKVKVLAVDRSTHKIYLTIV